MNRQMPLVILRYGDHAAVVTVSFQEVVEPVGNISACSFHELNFLVGDDQVFKHLHLFGHQGGEAGGIACVVAVGKFIFYHCPRIVVDNGAAHCELVQIVVGEVVDYLAHKLEVFRMSLRVEPPSVEAVKRVRTSTWSVPKTAAASMNVSLTQ